MAIITSTTSMKSRWTQSADPISPLGWVEDRTLLEPEEMSQAAGRPGTMAGLWAGLQRVVLTWTCCFTICYWEKGISPHKWELSWTWSLKLITNKSIWFRKTTPTGKTLQYETHSQCWETVFTSSVFISIMGNMVRWWSQAVGSGRRALMDGTVNSSELWTNRDLRFQSIQFGKGPKVQSNQQDHLWMIK